MTNIPFGGYVTLEKLFMVLIIGFVTLSLLFGRQLFRSYQFARKLPGPSLWEIIFVHSKALLSHEILPRLFKITSEYDFKPWSLWIPSLHLTIISDPETIGEAFKSKSVINKDDHLYQGVKAHVGTNSLILNGPEWKVRRTMVSPGFNKGFLENNMDVIYEEANRLTQDLREKADGTELDILHYIVKAIIRSSIRSLGKRDWPFEKDSVENLGWCLEFGGRLARLKGLNRIHHDLELLFNKDYAVFVERHKQMKANIDQAVKAEMHRVSVGARPDMPLTVMAAANMKKNDLTEKDVVDELFFLLAASIDTTSTAISAVLYMLALHPEVQSGVNKEIESIFGNTDRPISPGDLPRLEYLERVIKESLRLFPSVAMIPRRVDEDVNLNGTFVPKGSTLIINFFTLHRNPNVYKDPLKFDPDRFAPGAQDDRHPYAFLPFSSGARNCAGRLHAMITMKTMLSTLLRNYRILPGTRMEKVEDIKVKMEITLQFSGTYVRIVPVNAGNC